MSENETFRRMQDVREELRVMMLEQPTTGERRTYSDGFAQGLCHAIRRIDSVVDPTVPGSLTPTPEPHLYR